MVGDPRLNAPMGALVMGRRSNKVFRYVTDWDFSSLYPSIIIATNCSPPTLIAKLLIEDSVEGLIRRVNRALAERDEEKMRLKAEAKERGEEWEENEDDEEEVLQIDDQGKDFMDNYMTGNILNTGKKYFNLPSVEEMCEAIENHYGIKREVV